MAMMVADLSFSASISSVKITRYRTSLNDPSFVKRSPMFRAEARSAESEKYSTNGRSRKMVPTTELMRSKAGGHVKQETVNGSVNGAVNGSARAVINGSPKAVVNSSTKAAINGLTKAVINGSPKGVVNGTSLVKGSKMSALVKTPKEMGAKDDPFEEELKVLPSDEGFSWAKANYNSLQRSVDIWSFVLSLRIRVLFDNAKWAYAGGFSEEKQKMRRTKTASWLREQVLQLGPTFIKLGQLSSTRSDLFPREFVDELAKLQDRVPAFSPKKAKAFIEQEMGCPVEVVFKEFEDRPIAAASLGQVHRAVLHNGERVAVKVQRPGLRKLFDIDLNVNITDEELQLLLSNCNVLEFLGIARCQMVTTIKTSHLSDHFKHLRVCHCPLLQEIELNYGLTTLESEYEGPLIPIAHPVTLTNVSIESPDICSALAYISTELPCTVRRLEMLSIKCEEFERAILPDKPFKFIHLRHLRLEITFFSVAIAKSDVLDFASLLEAAPFMEKLEFHMWMDCESVRYRKLHGELRSLPPKPHSHLKLVEITGFYGQKDQLELALYILRNSIVLEAMTIDPKPMVVAEHWPLSKKDAICYVDGYRVAKKYLRKADRRGVVDVLKVSRKDIEDASRVPL